MAPVFMKKLIITPCAILLLVLLMISLALTINGFFINNEGGNSLGGFIGLLFAPGFSGGLLIEQAVIRYARPNMKSVWLLELLMIALLVFIWGINGFAFSIG